MMKHSFTAEEAQELRRLHVEYLRAVRLAANAMRNAGEPLTGVALQEVLEGEERADRVVLRIREISGREISGHAIRGFNK
jgi:hypothetical protein